MTKRKLTVGALFAGTGGLELGLGQVLDVDLKWFAEFDDKAALVMSTAFPDVPNYGDVTQIDWDEIEPVDIITGGSPCQDLSVAGLRAGIAPGTRSGLWESMVEAIKVMRPQLVIWENVNGAFGASAYSTMEPCPECLGNTGKVPHLRALGRVLGDLSEAGYDAVWETVHGSDVGAPHRRERVFVIGYPSGQEPPALTHPTDTGL